MNVMGVKKKILSMLRHPFAAIRRIVRYVRYKPRFRHYCWSDDVRDSSAITCRYVSLGSNVRLGRRCRIQGVPRYGSQAFDPHIIIGSHVAVEQDLYLTCASRISIGDHTAIAAFVTITDIDHQYADPALPIEAQPITVEEVSIGPDCKIYNGAVILKGTRIGRHCVVAANAVVRGEFPDYCVIAGAPARVVKRYNAATGLWQRTDAGGAFLD